MSPAKSGSVRLAVYARRNEIHSLRLYRDALTRRLPAYGIEVHEFAPGSAIPANCDMLWDPGLGTRRVPEIWFGAKIPIVVTAHGIRSFGAAIEDLASTEAEFAEEQLLKTVVVDDWQRLYPRLAGVIAISAACAAEVVIHLGVPLERVHPIHLAIEREEFLPAPTTERVPRDYLFHVSLASRSRKNLRRMLDAYDTLPSDTRIPLHLKCQGALPGWPLPTGARFIGGFWPVERLAEAYRGARALVFPSIYEGFGFPILEAMACGCPVITSNSSACAEVAGDAALLVDPLSVESIAEAMRTVMDDDALALRLSDLGRRRADAFDWDRSAAAHARLFRDTAANR